MFKALGNLKSMFEQAQQMGGKVEELKAQLRLQKIDGSAGGGMVTVVVNGLGEMLQLKIDPLLVDNREREMIEDLVPAAVNQAREKAMQAHAEAMQSMAGGLNMPGLEKAMAGFGFGPTEQSESSSEHNDISSSTVTETSEEQIGSEDSDDDGNPLPPR
ncbi:MAG: YbaB/EbfC family nucleoid-associated protein [Pirellulaceae bacterium]